MWFPLALFTAFATAIMAPINKHQLKTVNPFALLFLNQLCSVIFMFAAIMFLGGIPQVTNKFFLFIFCASVLDVIAFSCSYWAIKHTPISLLAPLTSFTPVFATIFGMIFLHEIPTPLKLGGIFTIVLGMYLLNISDIKGGLLKPIQKLFSHPGVWVFFVEVIIFGITPIFQKQAIFEVHPTMPLFAAFIGNLFVTVYVSFYGIKKVRQEIVSVRKNAWFFLLFGLINTFAQLAAYLVFSTTYVGYATAIFSLSSLFTIILGGVIFKEKHIGERLLGAIVMIIGTVLLAL